MALQTEAQVRQMFKAIDETIPDPRQRPVLLFNVVNLVETKWRLQEVDPAFRSKQTNAGGLFGKPVVKTIAVEEEGNAIQRSFVSISNWVGGLFQPRKPQD